MCRSAHSNAYLYGFWWNKVIVLFDTLLEPGLLEKKDEGERTGGEEGREEEEREEEEREEQKEVGLSKTEDGEDQVNDEPKKVRA